MDRNRIPAIINGGPTTIRVEGDAGKPNGYISLWFEEAGRETELLLTVDDVVGLISELALAARDSTPLRDYGSPEL